MRSTFEKTRLPHNTVDASGSEDRAGRYGKAILVPDGGVQDGELILGALAQQCVRQLPEHILVVDQCVCDVEERDARARLLVAGLRLITLK